MKIGSLILALACIRSAEAQTLDEILARMMARNEWQDNNLLEFRSHRKFYARNARFKTDSTMYVQTVFRRPDQMESTVTRHEGSNLIRSRVFDKILEAEAETRATKRSKQQADIIPMNYNFALVGTEQCADRGCFRLRISPKQRSKYALDGEVWIDSEDFSIVRIHGTPAKKPSMWTLKTEIDRRYKKVDGIWLPERLDSTSDILVAGHSTLSIEYQYESVQTTN